MKITDVLNNKKKKTRLPATEILEYTVDIRGSKIFLNLRLEAEAALPHHKFLFHYVNSLSLKY